MKVHPTLSGVDMYFRSLGTCYRKLLISAFVVLVGVFGIAAFAEEPAAEKSEPKAAAEAPVTATAPKETPTPAAETAPAPAPETSPAPATQKTAARAEATPARAAEATKPPSWHKLQMRLSGSMCYACLKDLEDFLKKVPGVSKVKVEKPAPSYYQAMSPDVSSWADGVVLYDAERVPMEVVRGAVKQGGYHSYRVVDKVLDHEPVERDLKI